MGSCCPQSQSIGGLFPPCWTYLDPLSPLAGWKPRLSSCNCNCNQISLNKMKIMRVWVWSDEEFANLIVPFFLRRLTTELMTSPGFNISVGDIQMKICYFIYSHSTTFLRKILYFHCIFLRILVTMDPIKVKLAVFFCLKPLYLYIIYIFLLFPIHLISEM